MLAAPCLRSSIFGSLFFSLVSLVAAAPTVVFPVNAQIPPVARVGSPFLFQFSIGTFALAAGSTGTATYSLNNAPAWLSLDSSSRTFSGTPEAGDVGSVTLQLIAADSTGSSQDVVTLVIVDTPLPTSQGNLTAQLSAAGRLADPDTLAYYTSSPINIHFPQDTFSGVAPLWYIATSADRSPLPSWIQFHPDSLSFTGSAPPLSTWPQMFGVRLMASTVAGFEGTSLIFNVIVSQHQLVFQNLQQTVRFQPGTSLSVSNLQSQLLLDGAPINAKQLQSTRVDSPSWLSFNKANLELSGTPPAGTTSFSVNVSATDVYGETAKTVVNFLSTSGTQSSAITSTISSSSTSSASSTAFPKLFNEDIGTIQATRGSHFEYTFKSTLFTRPGLTLSVDVGQAASWLTFDEISWTISGDVPNNLSYSEIDASITANATASGQTQTQEFRIALNSGGNASSGNTSPGSTDNGNSDGHSLSKGALAAAIVVPLLILLALVILVMCLHRRKQRHEESPDDEKIRPAMFIKKKLSNNFLCAGAANHDRNRSSEADLLRGRSLDEQPVHDNIEPTLDVSDLQHDPPPKLEQDFSGLGSLDDDLEQQGMDLSPSELDVLRSQNRTSDGSAALRSHMPHDSMKLPTRIARKSISRSGSGRSSISPRGSMGIPSRRPLSGIGHGRIHQRSLSRMRFSSSIGRIDEFGSSEYSTPQESDETSEGSAIVPPLNVLQSRPRATANLSEEEKLRSARLVERSSSNMLDVRPLDIRRQSYITRRASSADRPLFSADSRQSRTSSMSIRQPLSSKSTNLRSGGVRKKPSMASESSDPGNRDHFPRVIGDSRSSMWTDVTDDGIGQENSHSEAALEGHDFSQRSESERQQRREKLAQRLGRSMSAGSSYGLEGDASSDKPHSPEMRPDSPTIAHDLLTQGGHGKGTMSSSMDAPAFL